MNNNSPLDQGLPSNSKPKRVRKTKHTFKFSDIKKQMLKIQVLQPSNNLLNFLMMY